MVLVGLTVGGWFASAAISKLINELIEYIKDQKEMQLGLKDERARLKKALPKIQAVLNAVDQGLIREENPPLEKWLWQLRDAADQADDVMDVIKYKYEKEKAEGNNSKVSKAITNLKVIFLRAVNEDPFLKMLKKAVKAIDDVAADVGGFYMLVQDLVKEQKKMVKEAISGRESSSVLNVRSHVFGREKEKDVIINKLLNPPYKIEGENFAVLPIIGIGGVGKTTLVQLVYNDPNVMKHFELRMWVCISNNFDVVLLTKKLYESVFEQRADFDSFDLIQKKLKEKLKTMRFLVVFDDVWNDHNKEGWDKLVTPLTYGKRGSMMLLTTRMKSVPTLTGHNLMDSIILEGLSECCMWDLFKECAFGGEPQKHMELEEIGRGIVKKLKGSPLAAKTVGGILCSNLTEVHWRSILESDLWNLEQGQNDIMPSLRLTYQYLPPHLKPCLSFCSIFPQDHLFYKNDLINMWIALGMVLPSVNGTMKLEDIGSKYFDDVLNKSIFIRPIHTFQEDVYFVMHDLIHDLSTLVSQGECLRVSTKKLVHVPNTVRHLYAHIDGIAGARSVTRDTILTKEREADGFLCLCKLSTSGLKNLRTLILNIDESHNAEQQDSLVIEILNGMKSLRILIVFARKLSKLPNSNSTLLHLRYLRLSSSKISEFSKSVSTLYLLETIVYKEFTSSASNLGMLINLRNLTAPELLLNSIAGIGRFTSLKKLSFSVRKDDGFKISELSNLKELQSLNIDRIENVGNCEEVIQAKLKNKVNLNKLSLTWTPIEPNKPHLNVLNDLEPHPGLKELIIRFYEGTREPPMWFNIQTLSNLVRLTFDGCTFDHLPCLEELPLLNYIHILNMNAIKSVIHECNPSSAFPSLKELSFQKMRAIEKWSLTNQPDKWMQCLIKLDVVDCPKLQVLSYVPFGVEELTLEKLGLKALPNLWNNENSKSGIRPSYVVISINSCKNLVSLTKGLLQNPEQLVALEELNINNCENLITPSKWFLPSGLQKLSISSCGYLDIILPKALELVDSLIELDLSDCVNITSLPPEEVFKRWKTLKRLNLEYCTVLTSLESLLGLSSIDYLKICGCPKLSPSIPSPLPLKASAQTKPLSVHEFVIDDPLLLFVEPIWSHSSIRKLTIQNISELSLLPELPPFLQELYIRHCSPELRKRCEKSGSDWPKLSEIHKLILGSDVLSYYDSPPYDLVEEDNSESLVWSHAERIRGTGLLVRGDSVQNTWDRSRLMTHGTGSQQAKEQPAILAAVCWAIRKQCNSIFERQSLRPEMIAGWAIQEAV